LLKLVDFYCSRAMFSPKKNILNKESSFIIRKTVRPPTAGKLGRMRESPDKKGRDQRKSVMENYSYSPSRTLGPSSLGSHAFIQG
jgi:hypothetical protein